MENVLTKILNKKRERVQKYKKIYPINDITSKIKDYNNFFDFKKKLTQRNIDKKISIIGEIKKASPSAGILIKNFNYLSIAKQYIENGIPLISVLTEEDFFLGKNEYIKNIKDKYKIPILCKDFFIDTFQVPLAKSFGADCILIILSAVDKSLAKDLYQAALELNISALIEVHTKKEAELALTFENSLVGINNRNLTTLEVSLNTTIELSKILKPHKNPLICESGIHSPKDIKFVIKNTEIYNFLIGESLLKSENISLKIQEFDKINL